MALEPASLLLNYQENLDAVFESPKIESTNVPSAVIILIQDMLDVY